MRWPYSIRNKSTAVAALAAVFFLVGFNNINERGHINDLEKSITSIYADRLMVESYILQLNHAIGKKQRIIAGQESTSAGEIAAINLKIDSLLAAYEVTYLTAEEAAEFEVLKQLLGNIKASEQRLLNNAGVDRTVSGANELAGLNELCIASLVKLSEIQTREGLHLKEESSAIVKAGNISSKFEMALLILMALVLNAVVLSAKPIYSKSQKSLLN